MRLDIIEDLTDILIYTDWANHYLEKCQKKRTIGDLQKDLQDSLLLVDVIEAVTGEKVPDIKQKPKNVAQVIENIGSCIRFVESLGVNVDGITAKDIKEGQLKSILGLFFSLSRFKQQQKSQLQQGRPLPKAPPPTNATLSKMASQGGTESLSRLPSPFHPSNANNSGISSGIPSFSPHPSPAKSANGNLPSHGERSLKGNSGIAKAGSQSELSRLKVSNVPKPSTGIPTPGSTVNNSGSKAGLKPPSRIQTPTRTKLGGGSLNSSNSSLSQTGKSVSSVPQNYSPGNKEGMLDKFKLFSSKEKGQNSSPRGSANSRDPPPTGLPKSATRGSNSSSGFSSSRSEVSETSTTSGNGTLTRKGKPGSETPKPSGTGLKSWAAKKGLKSPKPTSKLQGSKKQDSAKKVSGEAQTSPQLLRKRPVGAENPSSVKSSSGQRDSKTSEDTDADSAYAGFDSSSPSSSNPPSDSKLYSPAAVKMAGNQGPKGERKPPAGAPSPGTVTSPTDPAFSSTGLKTPSSGTLPKPTAAVKGIASPQTGLRPPTKTASLLAKPTTLGGASGGGRMKSSASNMDDVNGGLSSGKTPRSQSSVALKQPSSSAGSQAGPPHMEGRAGPSGSPGQVSSPTVGVVSPMTHHRQTPSAKVNSNDPLGGDPANPRGAQSDSNSSSANAGGRSQRSRDSPSARPDGISETDSATGEKRPCVPKKRSNDKLRESSGSPSSVSSGRGSRESSTPSNRTSSRLETTFDAEDVVTETLTEEQREMSELAGIVGKLGGRTSSEEMEKELQPMEPMVPRSSPYAFLKTLSGTGNSINTTASHLRLIPDMAGPEGKKPHLTLNRPLGSLLDPKSAEEGVMEHGIKSAAGEVPAGYVSDGGALLSQTARDNAGFSGPLADLSAADLNSGYMSEGGISLYAQARKLEARFREGLVEAVRDSMQKGDGMNDSFEDSSSLSSGLSENIDEISTDDLTGSSLSDHHSAYQNGTHPSAGKYQAMMHQQKMDRNKMSGGGRRGEGGSQPGGHGRNIPPGALAQFNAQQHRPSPHDPAAPNLQQRKQSEQESINQLLQKSRTSARGLGIPGGSQSGNRPKSEQMNGIPLSAAPSPQYRPGQYASYTLNGAMQRQISAPSGSGTARVQMTPDGHAIRVPNGGQQQFSSFRSKTPLTGNTMKMLRDAENSRLMMEESRRPGSAQGNGQPHSARAGYPGSGSGAYGNGFHSLDRKRHLMGYYSETDAGGYGTYGTVGGRMNGGGGGYNASTLAMISPRRVPIPKGSLSLPVSHEGPLPHEEEAWLQQQQYQMENGHPARPNGVSAGHQQQRRHQSQSPAMSRSMIEHSRNLKISPQSPQAASTAATTPQSPARPRMANGHARLSVPPSELNQQNGNNLSNGNGHHHHQPRMARSTSGPRGQAEGIYANLIQRANNMEQQRSERTSPQSPGAMSGPPPMRSASVGSNAGVPPGSFNPGASPYLANMLNKANAGGGDEEMVHGSSLSLASNSSSFYSSEEKYQAEIRKLCREVDAYKDKVHNLTAQQSTYTTMVQAFEKALQGMAKRVEALQSVSQQKDAEVNDLKVKILSLRELGTAAGINVEDIIAPSPLLQRRHTFNDPQNQGLVRHPSCESVVSTLSQKSSLSTSSKGSKADKNASSGSFGGPKGKKSWIRSSFSRAFKGKKNKNGSMSDVEEVSAAVENGADNQQSPLQSARSNRDSASGLSEIGVDDVVMVLKDKLAEKDSKLTDMRLDVLTSAQEMDHLREAVAKLKAENSTLKQDREKLKRMIVIGSSHHGSNSSLPLLSDGESESLSDFGGGAMSDNILLRSSSNTNGDQRDVKRVRISVLLNLFGDLGPCSSEATTPTEVLIGHISLGKATTWERLDEIVAKIFNEYLHKVDPIGNLNLNNFESVLGYRIGEFSRFKDGDLPKDHPSACLSSGPEDSVQLVLRGVKQGAVDALSFETLIPKSYLLRLVTQVLNGRRAIICGSNGIGKTYLATKLAEHAVLCSVGTLSPEMIEVISVAEGKAATENLKNRLAGISQKYQNSDPLKPIVIILDNLGNLNLDSFAEVFGILSGERFGAGNSAPFIIATMSEPPSPTLQIQHNFKILLLPNHTDPVKGFLGRYLRRRLIQEETVQGYKCPQEMVRILEWLPKVWEHLNKYLEVVNLTHVTIGPRVFLSCPLSLEEARDWFIHLWNTNIHPYLIQATKEGAQMGRGRGSLEDPSDFVCDSWPWNDDVIPDNVLSRLGPDDQSSASNTETSKVDPLMMLVRLRGEQSQRNREHVFADS